MTAGEGASLLANLLKELDGEVLSPLAPRVAFRKGIPIGTQGSACESLYVIVQGRVVLSRKSADGESYALYLLGPGELFGEGCFRPEKRWMVTANPVTSGAARVIPAVNVRRILQLRPDLTESLLSLLSARLERTYRRVDVMTASNARERVLGLLLLMADYHGQPQGDEVWLPLDLSQAQIGEMVGLARETVGRVFSGLEEDGTIRRANRQGVWLRMAAAESQHLAGGGNPLYNLPLLR